MNISDRDIKGQYTYLPQLSFSLAFGCFAEIGILSPEFQVSLLCEKKDDDILNIFKDDEWAMNDHSCQ